MAQDDRKQNLVEVVRSGVKNGFVTIVTTALVSALVSACVAVWAAIQFVPNYVGLVPAGIVAAYWSDAGLDRPNDHCPKGWSPLDEARGRFIVAAGTPFHSAHKQWAPGRILDTREPLKSGGSPEFTLTAAQIPPHTHPVRRPALHGQAIPDNPGYSGGGSSIINDKTDLNVGGGQPVSHMPPYLALYYCRKN